MPNTSSAKKALRGSIKKNQINRLVKTRLRQAIKKAEANNLPETYSMIDKAAKVNVIHPNKAARLKSKLAKNIGQEPEKKTPKTAKGASKAPAGKKTVSKNTTKKTTKK